MTSHGEIGVFVIGMASILFISLIVAWYMQARNTERDSKRTLRHQSELDDMKQSAAKVADQLVSAMRQEMDQQKTKYLETMGRISKEVDGLRASLGEGRVAYAEALNKIRMKDEHIATLRTDREDLLTHNHRLEETVKVQLKTIGALQLEKQAVKQETIRLTTEVRNHINKVLNAWMEQFGERQPSVVSLGTSCGEDD